MNIDELERRCRKDFNTAQGSYFEKQEKECKSRWSRRGLWAGVVFDLLIVCLFWRLSDWSWSGFLVIFHRAGEKGLVVFFALFLLPFVMAVAGTVLGSDNVEIKKELSYQKFKESWSGCKVEPIP